MEWQGQEESENVEDRRGMSSGGKVAVGGGAAVLLLILSLVTGVDLTGLAPKGGGPAPEAAPDRRKAPEADDKTRHFVGTILAFTEKVWGEQFQRVGKRYEKPELVLFTNQVSTGCGTAPSAVGPFYCPVDRRVYLDPTFFDELQDKLQGSKGEFSQAYVIAHEVGHHVQNLLGYSDRDQKFAKQEGKNPASIRLELQADYLAGVWAHYGQEKFHFIQPGDMEGALKTAQAIGDDRLQKRARGWASPESFTHGSSQQRINAFQRGFDRGEFSSKALDRFFDPAVDPHEL